MTMGVRTVALLPHSGEHGPSQMLATSVRYSPLAHIRAGGGTGSQLAPVSFCQRRRERAQCLAPATLGSSLPMSLTALSRPLTSPR